MPHQCTACGHAFADGSKDMLGGCPDCGGNKFQFFPEGTDVPDDPPADAAADAPDRDPDGSSVASAVGRATTRVRDFVSADAGPVDPSGPDRDETGDGDLPADAAGSPTAGAHGRGADANPDPDAPWPDSSDAADPIRKGGFDGSATPDGAADPFDPDDLEESEGIIDADARATREALDDAEDLAQSDARSSIASDAEVAAAADATSADAAGTETASPDAANAGVQGEEQIRDGDLAAAEATVDRDDAVTAPDERTDTVGEDPPRDDEPSPGDETPEGRVVSEPTGEEPDLAELREQLNDQFESIKILEPGQYELNLMELYDREEYIIALQENGRYVIQVPEQWMGDRDDR